MSLWAKLGAMPINDTARTVAEAIKTGRQQLGWSQTDLAEQVGRTQTAISYWEAGKRTPGIDDLLDLSSALQKDISFFLPSSEERQQPIRAILRATATQLDLGELGSALQSFLDRVEDLTPPMKTIELSARRPVVAAQELVKLSGAREPPINVKTLAEECGALVLSYPFEDDLSGLVVELDGGAAIGVNDGQAWVRQRFTIAHELGHYLLGHHERFHIDLGRGDSDGTPPGYDWISERAANDFAAELLMPARLLHQFDDGERSAGDLAGLFDVSALAMGYRLANLGLR
jgi:Zn-dependent peptidase ImmA (M78 family)/DNA-binding XRE family transcriptional regulator